MGYKYGVKTLGRFRINVLEATLQSHFLHDPTDVIVYAFRFQPAQALFSSCVGIASCGGISGGPSVIQRSTLRYLYRPPAGAKVLLLVVVDLFGS